MTATPDVAAKAVDPATGLLDLLKLLNNPQEHEEMLAKLAAARDDVIKEQQKLSDLQAKRDALNKDRAAFESEKKAEWDTINRTKADLTAGQAAVEAARKANEAEAGALKNERSRLNQSKREHEERLDALARVEAALAAPKHQ